MAIECVRKILAGVRQQPFQPAVVDFQLEFFIKGGNHFVVQAIFERRCVFGLWVHSVAPGRFVTGISNSYVTTS